MTDTNGGTRDVARWLRENSRRPRQAAELWSLLRDDAHPDTGQITLTRDQIATRLDVAPGNVSRIMTELEWSGAIARRRDGRRVRCFIASPTGTETAGGSEPEETQGEPAVAPAARPDPEVAIARAVARSKTAEAARDSAEKRADDLEARLEETIQVLGRWRERAERAEKAEDELRRHKLARRRNRALAAILILALAAGAGAWWAGELEVLDEVFQTWSTG
ncbi:MAG: helix-turn-helix domain-containing protein [Chloroflexi bacterium]|nr:helix-turn-helix domain-containing protein [Chloroflexota bacterium]